MPFTLFDMTGAEYYTTHDYYIECDAQLVGPNRMHLSRYRTDVVESAACQQAINCRPRYNAEIGYRYPDHVDTVTAVAVLACAADHLGYDKQLVHVLGDYELKGPAFELGLHGMPADEQTRIQVYQGSVSMAEMLSAIIHISEDSITAFAEKVALVRNLLERRKVAWWIQQCSTARQVQIEEARRSTELYTLIPGELALVYGSHPYACVIGQESASRVIWLQPKNLEEGRFRSITVMRWDLTVPLRLDLLRDDMWPLEDTFHLRWEFSNDNTLVSPIGKDSVAPIKRVVTSTLISTPPIDGYPINDVLKILSDEEFERLDRESGLKANRQ